MRRRQFIGLLGGAAAWPVAARAQQGERMRRIGVLNTGDDAEGQERSVVFAQALKQLGWIDGLNLRIDVRYATADNVHRHAAELLALAPDVLVAATGTATAAPLLQATRTVPIVFVSVIDPVGAGFVASLARPGGNATGFTVYEYGMSGKWLELLKEIAPRVTRAAVLRDPAVASGIGQFGLSKPWHRHCWWVESDRRARCRRNRARRLCICAISEWWPDRGGYSAALDKS